MSAFGLLGYVAAVGTLLAAIFTQLAELQVTMPTSALDLLDTLRSWLRLRPPHYCSQRIGHNRVCPTCHYEKHDGDARFCSHCEALLDILKFIPAVKEWSRVRTTSNKLRQQGRYSALGCLVLHLLCYRAVMPAYTQTGLSLTTVTHQWYNGRCFDSVPGFPGEGHCRCQRPLPGTDIEMNNLPQNGTSALTYFDDIKTMAKTSITTILAAQEVNVWHDAVQTRAPPP